MKYGIISDIHGNLPALEAVLSQLKKEVDVFLCLGDIVGYGAQPNDCCELVRELKPIIVAGNHDWGAVGKIPLDHFNPYAEEALIWTQDKLTSENREFLSSLPKTHESPIFTLVHGSLLNPLEEYLMSSSQARDTAFLLTSKILFFGHTHIPTIFFFSQDVEQPLWISDFPPRARNRIPLRDDFRYLINPGSVGQPRDGDPRACAAVFDSEKMELMILRYEYPIDEAQRRILSAGLPPILAKRLSFGW